MLVAIVILILVFYLKRGRKLEKREEGERGFKIINKIIFFSISNTPFDHESSSRFNRHHFFHWTGANDDDKETL